MKTRYVVSSLIVVLLVCMSGTIASAQLFNTSAIEMPSFSIPSNLMDTSLYSTPSYATSPAISSPDYSGVFQQINSLYHPDMVTPDTASTGTDANATASTWQMPAMPALDFSSFGSSATLSDLLSSPVTQSVGPDTPNATNNYTMDSNNQVINMTVGDTIYIQLPASIDTGALWNLTTTNGLNVTNQRMYPPTIGASSGSSGIQLSATQEWDVQAIAPGVQKITATCSGPVAKTYTLTVNVKS